MLFLWIGFFDTRFFLKHKSVPLRIFLVLWDKNLSTENIKVSLLSVSFFGTRFFLKHRGVSQRKFLVLWDKKLSTENSEIPLLSVKFFENWVFLKQRRVAIRNFSGLWDTDFDKKSWYPPLFSYPWKFSIPEVFWNTKGSPYYIFQNCVTKTLTKNCETSPSSLIHKNFDTRSFLKQKRVHLRNFWTLWDKKLIAENSDIPFLCVNFFHTRLFLKHRRILLRIFLVLWDKKLTKTCETTPLLLSIKIFDTRNFSETQKGSSTKCFGTVRQNSFYGKSWHPPPLLSLTFFDTRRFLKHRSVFQRIFW